MTAATLARTALPMLSAEQLAQFADLGHVTLPAFLPSDLVTTLKAEVDVWVGSGRPDDRYAQPTAGGVEPKPQPLPKPRMQLELPGHGRLASHPPLMAMLTQILGEGFAYHHLHTARHDPGCGGVNWHHDYEQHPQTNRSHGMVHVFFYLNGLDGTIGDLLVLPGSQRMVLERGAFGFFGTADLPGSIVINDLPPGSAVIVHSAALHARRAKPGGEGRPRYFIDSSYCQAGVQWPSANGQWRLALRRALELGLDRGGAYRHLFDEAHFYDSQTVLPAFAAHNVGSLATTFAAR